uniref:Retrotransposon protein, putative, unclassified n=1 Tax=Oryza sativa subsp. japonica TaxID=39947 RepID=Q2QSW6_ORYSJ|nr:retrotransposon protein, putative, unclassified [Oryza sativa Japonica Group]
MDLDKSTSTTASLKKLQDDSALPGRGTMQRETGGIEPEPMLGRMVVVEDYISCGVLPPPSEFLLLVLNIYGLSLLHLNPNSIEFLSILSYLCEAYIGAEPFLELFRFYYELRWMEPNRVSGSVGFRIQDCLKSRYIPYQCPSSRSKWRARWFYLQIENSDPVLVVPEEQPDKIPEWTAKPALTPSLQSFINIIDDLQTRGLSGYEVVANFIGLDSGTLGCRVGQVMISTPLTASDIPIPLCEKGPAEREAASTFIKGEKLFVGWHGRRRRKTGPARLPVRPLQRPRQMSRSLLRTGWQHRVAPPSASCLLGAHPLLPSPGGELQAEMECLLQAGAHGVGREIEEARAAESSANHRAEQLARDLAEAREDLVKMRELVAGNERQRQGLEHRMSKLENNLSEIRGSLRVSYTGLHQLAGECGVTTTIPANPDEFSLMSSLAELATAMEEIPSKHAARIGEETSNGIYTGACHVLTCVRLAHPDLDLKKVLGQGAVDDARKGMMEEVDVDVEDVQQCGQLDMLVIVLALALEPFMPREETKLEVAELERTMVEVKKDQDVEALRGRELEGIGKHVDEALKQECRRASRYAGGHVLASIRDHRPQLHLEFLNEGFSHSRRTPVEIDGLAQSMAPLAEKVFRSMDWRWPSW